MHVTEVRAVEGGVVFILELRCIDGLAFSKTALRVLHMSGVDINGIFRKLLKMKLRGSEIQ